jgi:hypothetical protein
VWGSPENIRWVSAHGAGTEQGVCVALDAKKFLGPAEESHVFFCLFVSSTDVGKTVGLDHDGKEPAWNTRYTDTDASLR